MTTGVSTGRTAIAVEVGQKIVVEDGMSSYTGEVRRVQGNKVDVFHEAGTVPVDRAGTRSCGAGLRVGLVATA